MYVIIASVKGSKDMTNAEIKAAFDAEYDPLHDTEDDVQAEKDSGFLKFEDGNWNQYAEFFNKKDAMDARVVVRSEDADC